MKHFALVSLTLLVSCFPATTNEMLSAVRQGDVVLVQAKLKGTLVAGSSAKIISWTPAAACERSKIEPDKSLRCVAPVDVQITAPAKLSVQIVAGLTPLTESVVR